MTTAGVEAVPCRSVARFGAGLFSREHAHIARGS